MSSNDPEDILLIAMLSQNHPSASLWSKMGSFKDNSMPLQKRGLLNANVSFQMRYLIRKFYIKGRQNLEPDIYLVNIDFFRNNLFWLIWQFWRTLG